MYVGIIRILGNISAGNDAQLECLLSLNVVDYLHRGLKRNQKTIRRESCWVLSNITAGNQQAIESVLSKQDLVTDLLNIISSDLPTVSQEAMYVLLNPVEQGNPQALVPFYKQIDLIRYLCDTIKQTKDVGQQNVAL